MQAFSLYKPVAKEIIPLVFDSPHSSQFFPPTEGLLAQKEQLLSGWDAYVDELWGSTINHGAHLLIANFSRMYIDANRAATDIDPAMVFDPTEECQPTKYSQRGMGLIWRFALPGVAVYERQLSMAEIKMRIHDYYQPYHLALKNLLDSLYQTFGTVFHIDCHSMKPRGNKMNIDDGASRPDVVLSDNLALSSCPNFVNIIEKAFVKRGYHVVRNHPYKGGYIINHYADKESNRHSVQIELNRALYMNEQTFQRNDNFPKLQSDLNDVAAEISMYVNNLGSGEL